MRAVKQLCFDVGPVRMPQTVYLDQWVWIELARVHYGRSEAWRDAYEAVITSAASGIARFPLSISHWNEIAKRRDDASRSRLVDFMTGLWKADAIRPWPQMLGPEAENAVRIIMDRPPIDLTNFVFGKGIGHVLGGAPTLVPKHVDAEPPSPAVLRKIADTLMSANFLAYVKDPDLAGAIRNTTERDEGFMSRMQANIDAVYAHPDKTKRHDIAEARFMTTVVGDALVQAMMKATPNPGTLIAAHMSSRDQIVALRQSMPTFHTFFELDHARSKTRRIKESDLWDLALNIAIPYCDTVVTETGWCNIAKSAGLDELYETKLVHNPTKLAALLRANS